MFDDDTDARIEEALSVMYANEVRALLRFITWATENAGGAR